MVFGLDGNGRQTLISPSRTQKYKKNFNTEASPQQTAKKLFGNSTKTGFDTLLYGEGRPGSRVWNVASHISLYYRNSHFSNKPINLIFSRSPRTLKI